MKYHLVSLGCQMNLSDGERVRAVMAKMGYEWTDSEEEANIIGILACSVRQKGIDKVYSKIHKWNKAKKKRNLITFISGCVLPADKKKFLKLFDIIFQMKDLPKLPEMIQQYGITSNASLMNGIDLLNENMSEFWNIDPNYTSHFEAFIPIQNGCDKFCTYCAVPYTRGREVSRPSGEIIEEFKNLIKKGFKSITLLGQNVNSYGLDKKGDEISFPELLDQIGKIGDEAEEEFWIYFTSPHPRDMKADVLHTVAKHKCLAKQIHIPIQSGDNGVLKNMNRKHDVATYRTIIENIRTILPQATIFTDVIVGFSGEGEKEIENSRLAMEEFKYNMAYIAVYSPRPGAKSNEWFDTVPLEVKKERHVLLTEELKKHTEVYNEKLVGKTLRVLVKTTTRQEGYLAGLTEGKINVRFLSKDTDLIGEFVDVEITKHTVFSLEGNLVSL